MRYDKSDRPKILALDLDGTALKYDGTFVKNEFGEALRGMVEELQKLKEAGVAIVIWSCRGDSPEMRAHLDKQEIPYDYVNDHPWNGPDGPRKIYADWYLDDKAIAYNGISDGLAARILAHKPWWKSADWL